MVNAPENTVTLDSLFVLGSKLEADLRNAVTSADISMSTSEVTQLTIQLVDQKFNILRSGLFGVGIPVRYKDLNFVVSNTETSSVNGNEGITIKCRSTVVQKLKNRTGTKVMKKASPSEFVISECKAVGARYSVQPSAKRASIARDKPKAGDKYDADQKPSTWTTFSRLADELGYSLFEMAGVIYFGRPTYFLTASKKSPLPVTWNTGTASTLSETVPACVKSVDSRVTTVQVTLPLERAKECRVGRAMQLTGVPTFDGYYLIDSVDYSLSGSTGRINLSASTPINPESSLAAAAHDNYTYTTIYKTVTTISTGHWPVDKKYPISVKFGVRGSWPDGFHPGVDFNAPEGSKVYAVYDGVACIGGFGDWYGKHILLKVGTKIYAYGNLSQILIHNGQSVKSGDVIGYIGSSGTETGSKLHLELRNSPFTAGKNCVDPIPFLGKKVKTTKRIATVVRKKKKKSSSSTSSTKKSATKYNSGRTGTKTAADFVSHALSRKGDRYVFGATRDTSNKNLHVFDCSSLVRWSLARAGIGGFPPTTYTQLAYLRRKGHAISMATAYRTRGAVMYNSIPTHCAISLGNGRTIEAANSRVGVVSYNAKGRGFVHAFRIPGLRY